MKITLSPSNNTTFTDAEGNFSFKGIEAQDYSVQAKKDGYLDKEEIKEFLLKYAVYVSEKEIAALIDRYDCTKDGRVTY